MSSSGLSAPGEIHDDSYKDLDDWDRRIGSVIQELQADGYEVEGVPAAIDSSMRNYQIDKTDATGHRLQRARVSMLDIEKRGDELQSLDEAKRLVDIIRRGQDFTKVLIQWYKGVAENYPTLALDLYDYVNATGADIIKKRDRDVRQIDSLIASIDLNAKNNQIDSLKQSEVTLSGSIQTLRWDNKQKDKKLEEVFRTIHSLRVDLASRPAGQHVEGDDVDHEREAREALQTGYKINTENNARLFSALDDWVSKQTQITAASIEPQLQALGDAFHRTETNRKNVMSSLQNEKSNHAATRLKHDKDKQELKQEQRELTSLQEKLDNATKFLRQSEQNERKVRDQVHAVDREKQALQQQLRRRDDTIQEHVDTITELQSDISAAGEKLTKQQIDAAKAAGTTGEQVRVWTEKYHDEVRLRKTSEEAVVDLRRKIMTMEFEYRSKQDELLTKTNEAKREHDSVLRIEKELNAADSKRLQVERSSTEMQDAQNNVIMDLREKSRQRDRENAAEKDISAQLRIKLDVQEKAFDEERAGLETSFKQAEELDRKHIQTLKTELETTKSSLTEMKQGLQQEVDRLTNEKSAISKVNTDLSATLQAKKTEHDDTVQELSQAQQQLERLSSELKSANSSKKFLQEQLQGEKSQKTLQTTELKAEKELKEQYERERDAARGQVAALEHKINQWRQVIFEYGYNHASDVNLSPVLQSLKTQWIVATGTLKDRAKEWLQGFDKRVPLETTAREFWFQSMINPENLTLHDLIGVIASISTINDLGYLEDAIRNILKLSNLNWHCSMIVARGLEYLGLVLIGGWHLDQVKDMHSQFGTKLDSTFCVPTAFHKWLKQRFAGKNDSRGVCLAAICPAGIELGREIRLISEHDFIWIVRDGPVEMREKSDIKAKVGLIDGLEFWVDEFPEAGHELKVKLAINPENINMLADRLPGCGWTLVR